MDKVRITEIAAEISGKTDNTELNKELIAKANEIGIKATTPSSAITLAEAAELHEYHTSGQIPLSTKKRLEEAAKKAQKTTTKTTSKSTKTTAKTSTKTAEKSSEKAATKSTQKPTSAKKSTEKSSEKVSQKPSTAKKSTKKTAEKSAEKTIQSTEQEASAKKITIKKSSEKSVDSIEAENTSKAQNTKEAAPKNAEEAKNIEIQSNLKEQNTQTSIESKTDSIEEQKTQEAQNQQMPIIKRTGLRIVKKHDEGRKKPQTSAAKEVAELLGAQENDFVKHKKRKDKQHKAQKREHDERVNFLEDRGFRDFGEIDDDEDEGVVMFDLSVRDEIKFDDEVQKKATADRVKITRHNPFMEQGSTRRGSRKKAPKIIKTTNAIEGAVEIAEEIRAYEFAEKIGRSVGEVIKVLFSLGKMVTKNDFLERDELEILAEEFGVEIKLINENQALDYTLLDKETPQNTLIERAPVVTIMGHVDHGKTSLLDYIRSTKVASGEAGGITQHIGAYSIIKNDRQITFIDTPGHEAFSAMRARGAQVTDIAIIVIAADDGVKPQTIEALNHAKAANAPIIIAVNKIDKQDANPDKLKAECAELGYTPLEWGGETEFVHISAKTGAGIDTLLETILLQADILELKADPNRAAKAIVIESSLQKGRGPVATVIVQSGTLKVGDPIIADTAFGRVRAISNDMGAQISEIRPSGVGVIIGLNEVPSAGSILMAVENDAIAREYAQKRAAHARAKILSHSTKVSFDELSQMVASGQLQSLPVIIKADTQGSLEAIASSLEKLQNSEVRVNIVHKGVGGISESDISLASASANCVILGFNVRPTGAIAAHSKELGVQIRTYSIIYSLIDDIKAILSGLLAPTIEEENTGQAEVRETFSIAKVGTIAGCFVSDGVISRGIKVRLIRNGVVIHTGAISSLKRFKDDAKEVAKGYECGIMLEDFNDIQVGDVFETFKEVQKAREL